MKVAVLLHLYQPPTQEESVFRQAAAECYLPLLKLIKSQKNHKFTLNMPLSLLEQMDRYGYKEWISDVKDLVSSERLEVTGSGAYHPLLTKLPRTAVENQVVLNEYGLGYYFGARQGFEGEPSIMIKNLKGFFPPEMAVDIELLKILNDLSYEWVVVDETAIPNSDRNTTGTGGIYSLNEEVLTDDFKVVCRDRNLSNMLSFKRDLVMDDVKKYIMSKKEIVDSCVVALDGEVFGHHYKEGIFMLEGFLEVLRSLGLYLSSISEIIAESDSSKLSTLVESSWGASDNDMTEQNVYPYWIDKKNKVQDKLWDLQNYILDNVSFHAEKSTEEYADLPIWQSDVISNIADEHLKKNVEKYMFLQKFLNSDKFWWASRHELPYGKVLFYPPLIESALSFATSLSKYLDSEEVIHGISSRVTDVQRTLA